MINLPEAFCQNIEKLINEFKSEVQGLKIIVVATVDGFEVASTQAAEDAIQDIAKLSALSSSIAAIGSMAVKELDEHGEYKSISIRGDQGHIVILEVDHPNLPLIMGVVTDNDVILGQLMYQAKMIIADIAQVEY